MLGGSDSARPRLDFFFEVRRCQPTMADRPPGAPDCDSPSGAAPAAIGRELVYQCEKALLALPTPPAAAAAAGAAGGGTMTHCPAGEVGNAPKDNAGAQAAESLESLRRLLLGAPGTPLDPLAVDEATEAAVEGSFLEALVTRLPALTWAGRKEAVLVWSTLLPHSHPEPQDKSTNQSSGAGQRGSTSELPQGQLRSLGFMEERLDLVDRLVQGYSASSDLALHSGLMLRETLRSETVTRHVLEHGLAAVFEACDSPNFDVATDAFTTLKDLLRRHKKTVLEYLNQNYIQFFSLHNNLLMSDAYVTRRQAVKILAEFVLDRCNVAVMLRYITDKENLKIIMTLLKDPSKAIQHEAFHVFKIFVANPKRPEPITKLLQRNKAKLLQFLGEFHPDKEEDDFEEEKAMVVGELEEL